MTEQLFRKVPCKDRLPAKQGWYNCVCDDMYPVEMGRFWFDGTEFRFRDQWRPYKLLNVQWLEPISNNGWISVKDKTPDIIEGRLTSDNVLATNGIWMRVAYFSEYDGWDDYFPGNYARNVTHWKELPSLPKQDNND